MDDETASRDKENARLLEELAAVPREQRLDFLAGLPHDKLLSFKRILPRADIKKLNHHMDRQHRKLSEPSYEKWIAESRAGRATTPDAMVEVLQEQAERLQPQDAQWIKRITDTASAGSYSKKQQQVIRGIYERYFGSQAG